jgi:nucleotide-binding universal stress UspA family protein
MKILVCIDGSEQADRAVRLAAEIALSSQAEVTLLGIQERIDQSEGLLAALKRNQQLLEAQKVPAELISKSGNPVDEIVKRTREIAYDLVVIGAVRKGQPGPFAISTKAYKIIKLIKPPVLVVFGNPTGLKRILLCSGGKGYIESAFDLVGRIAQRAGASLSLLHVMPQPPAIFSQIRRLEEDADRVLTSNSELGRNLRREQQMLTALGIETEVRLRQGFVLEEIFREIRGGHYDVIVAGSSLSTGPLRTYVLGDITREIVNRADRPVLVARHRTKPPRLRARFWRWLQHFGRPVPPKAEQSGLESHGPPRI